MKKLLLSSLIISTSTLFPIANLKAQAESNFTPENDNPDITSIDMWEKVHTKLAYKNIKVPNLKNSNTILELKKGTYKYLDTLNFDLSRSQIQQAIGKPKNLTLGKKDFGSNYTFVQDYYGKDNKLVITYLSNKKNATDSKLKPVSMYFNYENFNLKYKDIKKNLTGSTETNLENNNTKTITDDTLAKYYGDKFMIIFERPNKVWTVKEVYFNK